MSGPAVLFESDGRVATAFIPDLVHAAVAASDVRAEAERRARAPELKGR